MIFMQIVDSLQIKCFVDHKSMYVSFVSLDLLYVVKTESRLGDDSYYIEVTIPHGK